MHLYRVISRLQKDVENGGIDERRFYSAGTICANRFIYHGRPHSWFENQCIWNYSHVVHLWSWFQKSKSLSSTKANKSSPIPIVISQQMFSVLYTGSGIIESVIHPGWSIVVTGPMPHVRSSLLAPLASIFRHCSGFFWVVNYTRFRYYSQRCRWRVSTSKEWMLRDMLMATKKPNMDNKTTRSWKFTNI